MSRWWTWVAPRRGRVVRVTVVVGLALAIALAVMPTARRSSGGALAAPNVQLERVAGSDRVATAILLAERSHPAGADVVVLVRADAFADALAAAPLAGRLAAPILLTPPDRLPQAVWDVLERLATDRVLVLGGVDAVADEVVAGLPPDVEVERVAGGTRYATAALAARRLAALGEIGRVGGDRTALLATGLAFPDGLAAGWPAALGGFPVLLTRPDDLPQETREVVADLRVDRVVVLGGPGAIAEVVVADLRRDGLEVVRLGGDARQQTAVDVADWATDVLPWAGSDVVLVRGDDFPDALAGGPYAAVAGGPLLLTGMSGTLGAAASAWLERSCPTIETVHVLGGTGAVSDGVAHAAVERATCGTEPPPTFPDAATTGVPAGTVLTVHPGNLTVTADGAVVEDLDIQGCLRIRANDVIVRRTRIRGEPCDNRHQVDLGQGVEGAVLEDVEIDGLSSDPFGAGIGNEGYTCRRCDIHHVGVGANMVRDVVVEDSWIHDIHSAGGSHNEAILSNGGTGFVVRGNRLDSNLADGTSSALSLYGDFEQVRDALVERNLFNGGGFCVYAGSVDGKPFPHAADTRFLDNHFGRELTEQCGWYGPVTAYRAGNGNDWSGNVWHDTGAEVPPR